MNGTPKYVDIPRYEEGEIRLIMKNAEYSTDLPAVFIDVENHSSQDSSNVDG